MWRLHINGDGGINRCFHRVHFRLNQWQLVDDSNITRHAEDTQAISTVWRYADFNRGVIEFQEFTDICTDWRIKWQFNNTVVIL
ncbi:hypothetical protein SRABI106_02245 [Rahnella aquatilis]|nr:hypothetical protein SRABI106_02245 [Rahnella aquatilis]